jgi:hypothetical protein
MGGGTKDFFSEGTDIARRYAFTGFLTADFTDILDDTDEEVAVWTRRWVGARCMPGRYPCNPKYPRNPWLNIACRASSQWSAPIRHLPIRVIRVIRSNPW